MFEVIKAASHEMNQPMQVMVGNLELLKMSLKKKDSKNIYVKNIMVQLEKLGMISKNLAEMINHQKQLRDTTPELPEK